VEGAQGKPARKGGKRCTAGGRGKNYAKFQDILQSKKRKEAGTNQNTVGTGIKVYPPPPAQDLDSPATTTILEIHPE